MTESDSEAPGGVHPISRRQHRRFSEDRLRGRSRGVLGGGGFEGEGASRGTFSCERFAQ